MSEATSGLAAPPLGASLLHGGLRLRLIRPTACGHFLNWIEKVNATLFHKFDAMFDE